jgi:hypothetical protein
MVRLAIVNQDGNPVALKDVTTAAELLNLVEQARGVIRECERLARQIGGSSASDTRQAPYMT